MGAHSWANYKGNWTSSIKNMQRTIVAEVEVSKDMRPVPCPNHVLIRPRLELFPKAQLELLIPDLVNRADQDYTRTLGLDQGPERGLIKGQDIVLELDLGLIQVQEMNREIKVIQVRVFAVQNLIKGTDQDFTYHLGLDQVQERGIIQSQDIPKLDQDLIQVQEMNQGINIKGIQVRISAVQNLINGTNQDYTNHLGLDQGPEKGIIQGQDIMQELDLGLIQGQDMNQEIDIKVPQVRRFTL